jgi:hypothetical protein
MAASSAAALAAAAAALSKAARETSASVCTPSRALFIRQGSANDSLLALRAGELASADVQVAVDVA